MKEGGIFPCRTLKTQYAKQVKTLSGHLKEDQPTLREKGGLSFFIPSIFIIGRDEK